MYEARQIRDAEVADPGVIRRTIDERLAARQEPTKSAVREAVTAAAIRGMRPTPKPDRANPLHVPNPQRDAATFFVARCKDVAEAFEQHGAGYLVAGNTHEAELQRAVQHASAARDALNKFLEACDARLAA